MLKPPKKRTGAWIEHAIQLMQKDELQNSDSISWAAYFASRQPETTDPAALISLLPLFNEKAATFAMVKHGMDIQRQITAHLNPGQIPVTAFDQPLFALAKYVQWQFPDIYGEQHYVVMFGGLHIEMALWSTIGELLEDSGWTNALCEAAVANQMHYDACMYEYTCIFMQAYLIHLHCPSLPLWEGGVLDSLKYIHFSYNFTKSLH